MSKGSKARPFSVDKKTFDERWDKIFAKGKEQKPAKSRFDAEEKDFRKEEGSETEESRSIGLQ